MSDIGFFACSPMTEETKRRFLLSLSVFEAPGSALGSPPPIAGSALRGAAPQLNFSLGKSESVHLLRLVATQLPSISLNIIY